jgi:hypothetical protein
VAPVDRNQVVVKVQRYLAEGKCWVVALDLEKFFNRVNHDKLMAVVARWVADKRVLKLCGHFPPRAGGERAPPPLLSNPVLNELDRLIRNSFCGYVARGGNLANILSTAFSSFLVSFSGLSES